MSHWLSHRPERPLHYSFNKNINFPCLNINAKINSCLWVIWGDSTNEPKATLLGPLNPPSLVLQFRDQFAIPFPIKCDRCSLDSQAALTSISLQWTSITLGIQYYLNEWSLVLLESSNSAKCLQADRTYCSTGSNLGGACLYSCGKQLEETRLIFCAWSWREICLLF